MKRFTSLLLVLVMLFAAVIPASAAGEMDVAIRIEGIDGCLYYSDVSVSRGASVYDVLKNVSNVSFSGSSVASVGNTKNGTFGGSDSWRVFYKSTVYSDSLDSVTVNDGSEVVLYYGDDTMQFPVIDMNDMMSRGVVKFISKHYIDGTYYESPVVGAYVTWDGMEYITDTSGEIIIDSSGIGVAHDVQIVRENESGLPTVLRFATAHQVTAGFTDIPTSHESYDAIMYVVNRGLFNGTTTTTFSPDMEMNRAMFVTVLGRFAGVSVNHDAAPGFNDINYDGWSVGYIGWAYRLGVINGIGNNNFGQYRPLTREQLLTMLHRYADKCSLDVSDSASLDSFTDGSTVSEFAVDAVKWAVAVGIVPASSSLRPTENATRAEVAYMLMQFEQVMLNGDFELD